jgi:intergrase/recombinase
MSNFIVFNTLAQARNFIKRQQTYHYTDGCGCCYYALNYFISNKKVVQVYSGSSMGRDYRKMHVLGRIKGV